MTTESSQMRTLFQQIESVCPLLHGHQWGGMEKPQVLAAMVVSLRPEVSVEIGVFGGNSFMGLALAHKYIGHGIAVGIDPWNNAAACDGYEGENLEYWKRVNLEEIYQDFKRNVFEQSTSNVVRIEREKSDNVVVPQNIGLLHIDGQHSEQAVRDVRRFAANVRAGGIAVLDDTGWQNGSDAPVQRAVALLTRMGFCPLYKLGSGEVFQRL